MRPPRRQVLIRFSIALLMGLLATLSAAWIPALALGLPATSPFDHSANSRSGITENHYHWIAYEPTFGVTEVLISGPVSNGSPTTHQPPSWAVTGTSFAGMSTFAYGWPARSSRMVWAWGSGEPYTHTLGPALNFSLRGHPAALPITPIPTGFAINTLFYTLLALTTITLFRLIQRTRRRRHHRCTNCGYALHALTINTCPECGAKH